MFTTQVLACSWIYSGHVGTVFCLSPTTGNATLASLCYAAVCVCVWQRKTHQQDVIGIILYICSSNLKNSDRLIRKQIIKKKKNRWKNCFLSTCPPPEPPMCSHTNQQKKEQKHTVEQTATQQTAHFSQRVLREQKVLVFGQSWGAFVLFSSGWLLRQSSTLFKWRLCWWVDTGAVHWHI